MSAVAVFQQRVIFLISYFSAACRFSTRVLCHLEVLSKRYGFEKERPCPAVTSSLASLKAHSRLPGSVVVTIVQAWGIWSGGWAWTSSWFFLCWELEAKALRADRGPRFLCWSPRPQELPM